MEKSSFFTSNFLVPFNKLSLFSKDLLIFIISFISLFARVIPESVIDEINKDNPLMNGAVSSHRANTPTCIILDNRVFEKFTVADEPFAKALQFFRICVLVNHNLCRKLVPSLKFLIKFDERFKVTSVPFFIADFHS